jgi:hypothetical protein
MYYADNNKWPSAADITAKALDKYLDRGVVWGSTNGYDVASNDTAVYISLTSGDLLTTGVKDKLKTTAHDSGLFISGTSSADYAGGDTVYMWVTTK